ncbi:MAG: serine hydrolase [Thermoanaerobaculia bacterium]
MARPIALAAIVWLLAATPGLADFRRFDEVPVSPRLEEGLERVAQEAFARYPAVTPGNLSLTLIRLDDEDGARRASFGGDTTYHPASVVKLFFLAAAHRERAAGRLVFDAPLEEALRDMIVDSLNDATSYVVDRVTRTTSGPELEGSAWEEFVSRRNAPNRWFASMGYDVNVNGKTWCEGVYGREKQILGANREFRNRVTSDAVAALLLSLASRDLIDAEAGEQMLALMNRPLPGEGADDQVAEFGGQALPAGSSLWSKAGWTSEVRHDAMIVELPDGARYVAAILTRGAAADTSLIPFLSSRILLLIDPGA